MRFKVYYHPQKSFSVCVRVYQGLRRSEAEFKCEVRSRVHCLSLCSSNQWQAVIGPVRVIRDMYCWFISLLHFTCTPFLFHYKKLLCQKLAKQGLYTFRGSYAKSTQGGYR